HWHRPDGPVLLARILWGKGEEAAAKKMAHDTKAQQEVYRAQGKTEFLLLPNDEMLLDMIILVLARGTAAEWDTLMERAHAVAQGAELIEVLEFAGISALERGERDRARSYWNEA